MYGELIAVKWYPQTVLIIGGHVFGVLSSSIRMKGYLPFFPALLKISIWALDLGKGIAEQRLRGKVVAKSAQTCPNGCHSREKTSKPHPSSFMKGQRPSKSSGSSNHSPLKTFPLHNESRFQRSIEHTNTQVRVER